MHFQPHELGKTPRQHGQVSPSSNSCKYKYFVRWLLPPAISPKLPQPLLCDQVENLPVPAWTLSPLPCLVALVGQPTLNYIPMPMASSYIYFGTYTKRSAEHKQRQHILHISSSPIVPSALPPPPTTTTTARTRRNKRREYKLRPLRLPSLRRQPASSREDGGDTGVAAGAGDWPWRVGHSVSRR